MERKTLNDIMTESAAGYAAAIAGMDEDFRPVFELHFKRRKIFAFGDDATAEFLEKLTEYVAIYSPYYDNLLSEYPQVAARVIAAETSPADSKVTTKLFAAPDGNLSTSYIVDANTVEQETTEPNVGIPSMDELAKMRDIVGKIKKEYLNVFEVLFLGVFD